MVLIDFWVVDHRLHATWPLDDGLVHSRRRAQSEVAREGAGDAVALSRADFTDLCAEVARQNHLRSHRVHVGLEPLEFEGDPVVVVAVVHPKHVRVGVVRADVAVAVARIHVDLTVAVEVTKREAVHRVVVGESVGNVGEGLVSIVVVVTVSAPRVHQVDKTVVVEVLHLGLQEESRDFETAACRDVVEVARAIVLHEVQRRAVVGDKAIEIAIVVDVCKVCGPALLVEHKSALQRFLSPPAVSVVDPKLVDASRILRVVDKLAALGDEQIQVAVSVEVAPHCAVVAAVICVGVRAVVVVRQVNQCRRWRQRPFVRCSAPHAAEGVVVTPKHVEVPVVVNVREVASLHEHASLFEFHACRYAGSCDVLDMNAIVRTTTEHVFVTVVVKVRHAHAPLTVAADRSEVIRVEGSLCRLVQGVKHVALVEDDQIVVPVTVEVRESHATTAVVFLRQEGVGVGEGLGLERAERDQSEHGQRGARGEQVHGFQFLG